ncbi:oligopeptide/dipeptide ABC transporter ATPase [Haloferax elongans ATCC BAA-1513]|uniref:Oligopeptide/dipeptide ABC transporter ATPase n=1 Tax=Haloferax elongans ATCC BAA-1513 TaxID=1230453 RepID=M0HLQ2_HALEO|nr:ABC transporter ATP-binding protein [Haloferax elongans]ELZ84647.1 oligopeptide/dipeptide ABC transporter ATPase [Haloferax elongans ATCC BAA-1513]
MSSLLTIDGLTKHFSEKDSLIRRLRPDQEVRTVRAVDDVSLDVKEGETLGLVGESGCGKSTLARAAVRLIEPTDGSVYFDGDEVTGFSRSELREFRSEVQVVFQDPFASLNPRYTVAKTLMEPMRVHNIGANDTERRERAASLLERCGLGAEHLDRHPHEFSGGQRQRIAIARALSVEPSMLIADEPVSALDVSVQARILNLLDELREEMGLSMLFISHDMSIVRRVCDRVAVMYLGKIAEVAPTDRLFTDPQHPYTQALLSAIPVPDPTVERDRVHLEGDVPTPIDPPSGCRFHPRCPKVIPTEGWDGSQAAWQRVLALKRRLAADELDAETTREHLEDERKSVSDDAVVQELYDEHVARKGVADAETVSLPPDANDTVKSALQRLVAGDRDGAVAMLERSYTTPCAREEPSLTTHGAGTHQSACHLHDPSFVTQSKSQNGELAVDGIASGDAR